MKTVRNITLVAACLFSFDWVISGSGEPNSPDAVGERPFAPMQVSLAARAASEYKERLNEQLVFVDSKGVPWVAPRGTLTDGASIPKIFLSGLGDRFSAEFLHAAIVHDAYCQEINRDRCPDTYRKRCWRATHTMFYEACLAGGTPRLKARIMFAAVWLGGPRWDDPGRSLAHVPDEKLQAEFDTCRKWIEANDPPVQKIIDWMDRREAALRAE